MPADKPSYPRLENGHAPLARHQVPQVLHTQRHVVHAECLGHSHERRLLVGRQLPVGEAVAKAAAGAVVGRPDRAEGTPSIVGHVLDGVFQRVEILLDVLEQVQGWGSLHRGAPTALGAPASPPVAPAHCAHASPHPSPRYRFRVIHVTTDANEVGLASKMLLRAQGLLVSGGVRGFAAAAGVRVVRVAPVVDASMPGASGAEKGTEQARDVSAVAAACHVAGVLTIYAAGGGVVAGKGGRGAAVAQWGM